MRQQVSKDLFDYWRRLKGARAAPERADIDPVAIRGTLADTFIVEIDGASEFPMRLSGTRLNALWLREQKGESFLNMWRGADRHSVAAALLTVVDGVTPIVAGARAKPAGRAPLDLELLLLPLRHFGKTHSRVLGSLAPNYQPEWLGQNAAGALELVSLRVMSSDAICDIYRHTRFAERSTARNGPRLVVYEGGKAFQPRGFSQ